MTSLMTRNGHTTFPSLFKEMDSMDKMFDSMFQAMMPSNKHMNLNQMSFNPHIDLVDTDKAFMVVAEMPGMSEDDFTLSIDRDMLYLEGEKTMQYTDTLRRERRHGSFRRSIHMKNVDNLDLDDISASFENGVLTVSVPKKEPMSSPQKREIKISTK